MKFYQVIIATPHDEFIAYSGYDYEQAHKEFVKERRNYFGRDSQHISSVQKNTKVRFEEYEISRTNATEMTTDELCARCNLLGTNLLDDGPFQHNFEEITVLQKPALFCQDIIQPHDVPAGLHLCYVLYNGTDRAEPTGLTKNSTEQFVMGSLLSAKPFHFYNDIIPFEREFDWDITPQSSHGGCRYVWEFLEEYDCRPANKTRDVLSR